VAWNLQRPKEKEKELPFSGFESGTCRISDWVPDSHPGAAIPKGGKVGSKNTFVGKSVALGSLKQKLSLPELPIFPHSFTYAPSDLFLFLRLWRLLLLVPRAGQSLDGKIGEESLSDDFFLMLRTIVI
jgi:hypothetical protein